MQSAQTSRLGSWIHSADLVEYYSGNRDRPADLYPSERRFLPWLASSASSILDVGCGAGGFASIWSAYNAEIIYSGVDASPELIDAAAALHPGSSFRVADCIDGLPFDDRGAEVVSALGWLHWEPRYAEAIAELWRTAARYLFFDVRVHDRGEADIRGEQRLALSGDWDGATTVPYICASWPAFAEHLLALAPARILGFGYSGRAAETVVGIDEEICFATFVLERGSANAAGPLVALDLPFAWPEHLAGSARVDPQQLDREVPAGAGPAAAPGETR